MRTKQEMQQLIDEFDEKLAYALDWEPAALVLLDEFNSELRIWVDEGFIAHDDLNSESL